MNTIFIKQVPETVLKGKLLNLNYTNIGNEDYIIEINISNKAIAIINKNLVRLKPSVIKNVEKTSILDNIATRWKVNRFKNVFTKVINKNNLQDYLVIYSNELNKNKAVKEYINVFLENFNINEYVNLSTVKEHTHKYIDEFIAKNNLKDENIKLLFIVNNLDNISLDFIEELNSKYKEVDIFTNSKANKRFINEIKKINDEYGSCISIVNRLNKDMRKYNICIFIDEPRTKYVKYKFNKKTCFIDFTNKENDKFNENYIKLENGIRNNVYFYDKIKELYELYGKITTANAIIN